MTSIHRPTAGILLALLVCAPLSPAAAPGRDSLSVPWINSAAATEISFTGTTRWLSNNTLVFYNRRAPAADRQLELVDPSSGASRTLLRGSDGLAAMRAVLGDSAAPKSFPYPDEIDNAGRRGLYVFGGDLYALQFSPPKLLRLTSTAQEEKCASFSPDGNSVAFVRANNLYVVDVRSGSERQITADGTDSLLNGTLSWVYWEEVFGRRDVGYWWSEDSRSLAWFRTDESGVSVHQYVDFRPWTPRVHRQRYPKVGEKNPAVRVGLYNLDGGAVRWVDLGSHTYEYVVRVQWLPDNLRLAVQTMNRLQTELDLFFIDARSGAARHVLTERDSGWVNVADDLTFLADGKHFLWTSERDGFKHLYRYTMEGTLANRVTRGEWSLRSSGGLAWVDQAVQGVDEAGGWIYVTALEKSSRERHLYRVRPDGSGFTRVTRESGTHVVSVSPDGKFYVDRSSNARTLPALGVFRGDGTPLRVLAPARPELVAAHELQYPEFFSIPARDGFPLPAQILKPAQFDPRKKYPVIFYVYGGPSAPQVLDQWQRDIFWENLLTRRGYLVVRVDPRSATAISKTLENLVARRVMGDVELNDLVDAARHLKRLAYVDSTRLGLWGWSGGGTYTMLAMTKAKEFKAGIAVAGVTDFRFYDTKWAEAGMKTEKENRDGFEQVSLLRSAKNLHGRLMIVHGTYDDNVHIQNVWAFIDELIKVNKSFDLMVYPMRMHGIADPPARVHLYTTMLEFWERNL
jgi:dipeptidyl-peptidase-4